MNWKPIGTVLGILVMFFPLCISAEEDSELIEYNGKLYAKSAIEDVTFRCKFLYGEAEQDTLLKWCIDTQLHGFLRAAEFQSTMSEHTYKKVTLSCAYGFTAVQEDPVKGLNWAFLAKCYEENAEAMIQIEKRYRIYNSDLFEECYTLTDDFILWNECGERVIKNLGLTPVSSITIE